MDTAIMDTATKKRTIREFARRSAPILLVVLVLLAIGYVLHDEVIEAQAALMRWMSERPLLGSLCFVLVFAISVPLLIPSLPLMLAAGMLFGIGPGVLLAYIANTTGGAIAFLLSRSNLRNQVRRRIRNNDAFTAFDDAIRDDGLRTAVLIRMSPVLPGWLINYGLGLTGLRFRHYLMASVGTLPVILVYVSIGTTLHTFGELFSAPDSDPQLDTIKIIAMIVFVGSAIAVTQIIKRRALQSLERRRSTQLQEQVV